MIGGFITVKPIKGQSPVGQIGDIGSDPDMSRDQVFWVVEQLVHPASTGVPRPLHINRRTVLRIGTAISVIENIGKRPILESQVCIVTHYRKGCKGPAFFYFGFRAGKRIILRYDPNPANN